MRRREFISVIGWVAATWPLAVRAQQPTMPVIGFVSSGSPGRYAIRLRAFRQGLKDVGYIEGQNVTVEYRWAEDQNVRLPALVAELVNRRVAVIVAGGTSATGVVKTATEVTP